MNAAVVSRNDGFERRARVLPWGIEIQVWRLVETLTLPSTAATLPINSLFPEPSGGAIPASAIDDEKTLENPVVDEDVIESEVEFVYEGGGEGGSVTALEKIPARGRGAGGGEQFEPRGGSRHGR